MTDHFPGASQKTAAKLEVLEETLDVYTTIIQNNWDVDPWYIDTHAGTGRTKVTQTNTIDGSVLIALDQYTEEFGRFYFYELDEDNFHLLHETISDEFGYSFDIGPVQVDGHDFMVARHEDPYIRIMNQDSNTGVQFLADVAGTHAHWFAFIDPKGLTARRDTLDTLIDRGNVDILLNYQSEGVMRSASAEHAEGAVTRQHGDTDWPNAGTPDEYVTAYREKLGENDDIPRVISHPFDNIQGDGMRFDLVFACQNERVTEIIEEIMDQDELWEKASDRMGQSGLGDFT